MMSERHFNKHRAHSPSPTRLDVKRGAENHGASSRNSKDLSRSTRKRKRHSNSSFSSSDEDCSVSYTKKDGHSSIASRPRSRSEDFKLARNKKAKMLKDVKKRHKKKHSKTRRHYSSSDDSSDESSSTSESQSSEEEIVKRRKHSHKDPKFSKHKKTKKLPKDSSKYKNLKHKHKRELKPKKEKKTTVDSADSASTTIAVGVVDITPGSSTLAASTRSRGPMTKEEYEKQQSVVRRVFDPDTGRHRLVKGDGEIIEEIVSKERHKAINKLSTQGDGLSFQNSLRKLL